MKRIKILQIVSSLICISAAIILIGARLTGTELSDIVMRICGVSAIAALPVVSYTTVKTMKK